MEAKYTPSQYHVGMKPGPIVYGPLGEMVADCHIATNTREDNCNHAAYIVRACNHFEGLLDAAKSAHAAISEIIDAEDPFDMPPAWLDDLEQAIAASEEDL